MLNISIPEIERELAQPAFFKDEAQRNDSYERTASLGYRISELPQSADGLTLRWHFLNRLSIIAFYSIDDSLIDLMRARAVILEQCLRPLAKKVKLGTKVNRRKNILIIKPSLNLGPELASTIAHFKSLPKYFDVTIACQIPPIKDLAEKLIKLGFQLVLLPQLLDEMAGAIANFAPDIIIHSSNQSAVTNVQAILGAIRLAPIQIATTMSPVTTGLKTMDFYLTGIDNELSGFSRRYSESLLFVDGDINHYDEDFLEKPELNQDSFRLNDNTVTHELFVGGNLNKIGLPSLKVWLDILSRIDNAKLIIAPFNPNWQANYAVDEFKEWLVNLARQYGIDESRIELIGPFPSRSPILQRITRARLYLDTFPYSGAVSILDPILTNTPFITLAGSQARFRQSSTQASRSKSLGITTYSEREYLAAAVDSLRQTSINSNANGSIRQTNKILADLTAQVISEI